MATQPQRRMWPVMTISGNRPFKLSYPEASGQSFVAGEIVYLDGSGLLTELASNTPNFALGVAAQDASGVAATSIGVWIFNGDTIFEASVYHATAASAITANSLCGGRYELERVTADSKVYIDIASKDPNGPIILAIGNKDSLGDRYGRVLFQMHPAIRQLGNTS